MWRSVYRVTLLVLSGVSLHAQSDGISRTSLDSLIQRARRLGDDGSAADARKLLDSVLKVAPQESPSYPEALYLRAALATVAVDAERDYRRLLIEAPLSTRAEDAMLQLAQLEQARGDRRSATDHLQRFLLSYPNNPARPRVAVSLVRLLFEQGQTNKGCEALRAGRETVTSENLELRNQLEFYAPRCVVLEEVPAAPAADSTSAQKDTGFVTRPPLPAPARKAVATEPTAAPSVPVRAGASFYSVQVAAYDSPEPATRMALMLKTRGLDARVDGKTRPFRVRVGKYSTRAAAVKAAATLKTQGIGGFVALVKSER